MRTAPSAGHPRAVSGHKGQPCSLRPRTCAPCGDPLVTGLDVYGINGPDCTGESRRPGRREAGRVRLCEARPPQPRVCCPTSGAILAPLHSPSLWTRARASAMRMAGAGGTGCHPPFLSSLSLPSTSTVHGRSTSPRPPPRWEPPGSHPGGTSRTLRPRPPGPCFRRSHRQRDETARPKKALSPPSGRHDPSRGHYFPSRTRRASNVRPREGAGGQKCPGGPVLEVRAGGEWGSRAGPGVERAVLTRVPGPLFPATTAPWHRCRARRL